MENWFQIGDRNIRREIWPCSQIKCYPQDIKAIAPLGSMIAVVSSELGNLHTEESNVKCVLRIYNGSCVLLTSVKWYVRFDNIISVQWTDTLELVSVFSNGCIRVYSAHGELLRSFYLQSYGGSNSSRIDSDLVKYKIWSDGLLFVNFENQKLNLQKGFETQNIWLVDLGEFALSVTALGVVPNRNWNDVLVVISTVNGTSYIKMDHLMKCDDFEEFQKYLLQINPCTYTHISTSPYYYTNNNNTNKENNSSSNNKSNKSDNYYVGMGNSEEGLLTSLCINDKEVKILWEIKIEPFNNIYTLSEGVLAVTFSTTNLGVNTNNNNTNKENKTSSNTGNNNSTYSNTIDNSSNRDNKEYKTNNTDSDNSNNIHYHDNHNTTSPSNTNKLNPETYNVKKDNLIERKDKGSNLIRLIYNAVHNINIHNYIIDVLSDVGGGIRVFTRTNVEYLDLVSSSSELALSSERCDVTNSLLRTFEMFKKGHEKSSESLYSIRDKLNRASRICLEASKDQWDFDTSLLLVEFSIFASSLSSSSMNEFDKKNKNNTNNNNSKEDLERFVDEYDNYAFDNNNYDDLISSYDRKLKLDDNNTNDNRDRNDINKNTNNNNSNKNKESIYKFNKNDNRNKINEKKHILIICYLRLCRDLTNYNIFSNIRQLLVFGLNRLIILLTNLKLYLLSIRICEFFRINPTMVLLGWITTRIKLGTHLTDSELFGLITSRLDKYLGTVLSFSRVAQVVFKQGREVLALSFIEREKCPYKQFKVLIKWNELNRAAKVANECGDTNLINYIILKTINKNDISNIITLSKEYNLIKNIFVQQLLLSSNEKLLQIFYERINNIFDAGLNSISIYNNIILNRGLGKDSSNNRNNRDNNTGNNNSTYSNTIDNSSNRDNKNRDRRDDTVKEMKYSLNYSNGYFGNKSNPDVTFWYESVNNEMLLLDQQYSLERTYESLKSVKLIGKSVMETIYELYKLNLNKEVDILINMFKLPINQTRCTKISALYESHNVQELVNLVQDKQLSNTYIKGSKTYLHLILQILVNLGANTHVDNIIHNMKPSQQSYWKNFINQHNNTN